MILWAKLMVVSTAALDNQNYHHRQWLQHNIKIQILRLHQQECGNFVCLLFASHFMFNLFDGPHQSFNHANVMAPLSSLWMMLEFVSCKPFLKKCTPNWKLYQNIDGWLIYSLSRNWILNSKLLFDLILPVAKLIPKL